MDIAIVVLIALGFFALGVWVMRAGGRLRAADASSGYLFGGGLLQGFGFVVALSGPVLIAGVILDVIA